MLKKRIICLLIAALLIAGTALPAAAAGKNTVEGYEPPDTVEVYADSVLLMSLGSTAAGDVPLYAKNADEVHAPGAMMRYMVVAYTLRRVHDDGLDLQTATGTYTLDLFNQYVAGTGVPTANMNFGETWTVHDLLVASFLQNASDAITTLAAAVAGSVPDFIKGMNDLAKEIGCQYTHFSNVTGLDSLGQYTTPRDLYRIIRYAQSFSEFEGLVSERQFTVKPVSGGKPRTLVSVNSMQQSSSPFYYSPLVFSRTGLSDYEGRTCASVARDSGYEYLVVVMGCPEQNSKGQSGLHFLSTRNLFRWAFNNFEYTSLLAKSELLATVKVDLAWSTDHVNLIPADEFATVVDSRLQTDQIIRKITVYEDKIDAPVEKGTVLGKVELVVNVDQTIGTVDLIAADSISRSWLLYGIRQVKEFFAKPWFWLGLGALFLLIGGYVVLNLAVNRHRQDKRIRRVEKQDKQ